MKKKVCAIYDIQGGFFSGLFLHRSENEAKRDFGSAVRGSETSLSKYPEDYRLFCLGEYDDVTGYIKAVSQPELMASGKDFQASVGDQNEEKKSS